LPSKRKEQSAATSSKESIMKKSSTTVCPCREGNGKQDYADCCKPYHDGAEPANAELLMRARYSAYARGLMHYVWATWHDSTRPPLSDLVNDASLKWQGLEVKRHQVIKDGEEQVEFVARVKRNGRADRLQELSRFVREDGRWFYIDGEFPE